MTLLDRRWRGEWRRLPMRSRLACIVVCLFAIANCEAATDPTADRSAAPAAMTAEAKAAEMARLRHEIESQQARLDARPRRKFIAANTRELEYRAYMDGWVARIEQVGNLSYPEVALRNKSTANLVISVAVKRDGSVERVDIVKTSGQQKLDDAAMKLVRLAAPFEPLPETEEDIDVLHITRTWQFMPGDSR